MKNRQVRGVLEKLLLFDLGLMNGEKALHFDDKHCGKRYRGTLVSEKRGCNVDGIVIAHDQLLHMFQSAGLTDYSTAFNLAGRQNVPAVLTLLSRLAKLLSFLKIIQMLQIILTNFLMN